MSRKPNKDLSINIPPIELNGLALYLDMITPTWEDSIKAQIQQLEASIQQENDLEQNIKHIKQLNIPQQPAEHQTINELQRELQQSFTQGITQRIYKQTEEKIKKVKETKSEIKAKLVQEIESEISKMQKMNANITKGLDSANEMFREIHKLCADSPELKEKLQERVNLMKDIFKVSAARPSAARFSAARPSAAGPSAAIALRRNQTLSRYFTDKITTKVTVRQIQSDKYKLTPRNIFETFKKSIDSYQEYLQNKFNSNLDIINTAFTNLLLLKDSTENLTTQRLDVYDTDSEYTYKLEIGCTEERERSQTTNRIKLMCYKPRNEQHCEITLLRVDTSINKYFKMFAAIKGNGRMGFGNLHITQVVPAPLPLPYNFDKSLLPDAQISEPHMTINSSVKLREKTYLYFGTQSTAFDLASLFQIIEDYGINQNRIVGLQQLFKQNQEYIEDLKEKLEYIEDLKEKLQKVKTRGVGSKSKRGGGSTNKILKIKEQIKIIKAKYKTTKLDKYLIQIDKLKEKIEQLKLKDKKNKIKEQIKELKTLHKLNPKKAYVNKMIKLKEKLSNM